MDPVPTTPGLPPSARGRGVAWSIALTWVLALGAGAGLGLRAVRSFAVHDVQWAQDLAFFNQIFHAAVNGRPWTSPLLLEPVGFFDMVHFHPVFAALVPLYALRPHPTTLLGFNVFAVCLAAVPLAGLARERARSLDPRLAPAFGVAVAAAYLVWLPTQMAALADFRPMVFFVPGFVLLFHGVYRRSVWRVLLGTALLFGAREEGSYLVAATGAALLVVPFGGWRRRFGVALLILGVAWFGVLLVIKGNLFFHFDPRNLLQGLPEGPGVDSELGTARLRHLGGLLAGGFGPVLLCPAAVLAAAIPLVFLLTDAAREWHAFTGPYAYYRHPLLPLLAVGAVMGWTWAIRRLPRRWWRWGLMAAAGVLVAANALAFRTTRERLAEGRWRPHREALASPEMASLDGLIAQVRPSDRVATDYRLVAALSGREVLWNIAHLYLEDPRPPYWNDAWPLTLEQVDTVVVPVDHPFTRRLALPWVQVDGAAGYGLWRRRAFEEE